MGRDLFDQYPELLGDSADEILGWSLREMCLDTEEEVLTRTEHAQPALFALSYALFQALPGSVSTRVMGAAGHSLGEYSALAAAATLGYREGLAIVAERGRAMAGAADQEPSGMAAVLGADLETVEVAALGRRQAGGRLFVANINAPGQVVVAGGQEDLDWLEKNSSEYGLKRVLRLKVAGAFHTPFMAAAANRVEASLAGIELSPPAFPVWSNVTAVPHQAEMIKEVLVRQITAPVRFSDSLADMAATGIDTFVHVGPGDVTVGLAKRSAPGATCLAVSDLGAIPPLLESLGTIDAEQEV